MAEDQAVVDEQKATLQQVKQQQAEIKKLVKDALGPLKAYKDIAADLAEEFARRGITVETLHNAPIKVKTTYGADIYEVVELLQGGK